MDESHLFLIEVETDNHDNAPQTFAEIADVFGVVEQELIDRHPSGHVGITYEPAGVETTKDFTTATFEVQILELDKDAAVELVADAVDEAPLEGLPFTDLTYEPKD